MFDYKSQEHTCLCIFFVVKAAKKPAQSNAERHGCAGSYVLKKIVNRFLIHYDDGQLAFKEKLFPIEQLEGDIRRVARD